MVVFGVEPAEMDISAEVQDMGEISEADEQVEDEYHQPPDPPKKRARLVLVESEPSVRVRSKKDEDTDVHVGRDPDPEDVDDITTASLSSPTVIVLSSDDSDLYVYKRVTLSELKSLTWKLINALTFFDSEKNVPLYILRQFHEDINLLNRALEFLEMENIVKLDLDAETKTLNINQNVLESRTIPWSHEEEITASREVFNILRPFLITVKDESVIEETLPHIMSAWRKALKVHYLVHEFIHFPNHILNKLKSMGVHERCLDFSKDTLVYFRVAFGQDAHETMRFEFQISQVCCHLAQYPIATKYLKRLAPRARVWNPNSWLTKSILKNYVDVLQKRKMFVVAYREQSLVCKYYSENNGNEEDAVVADFIRASIMVKIGGMAAEAEKILETVLDWALKNKHHKLIKEARYWLERSSLVVQADKLQKMAQKILNSYQTSNYAEATVLAVTKLKSLFKKAPEDMQSGQGNHNHEITSTL